MGLKIAFAACAITLSATSKILSDMRKTPGASVKTLSDIAKTLGWEGEIFGILYIGGRNAYYIE